ncbi:MAG: amidohydrolase [Pirellulaceae bacterium]|nr:amidohydrolase [Pirellulaceae bacterium]
MNDEPKRLENDQQLMASIDAQVAHIWMVRTFLKHSDEVKDDEELASVHRDLYDFMLALGPSLDAGDAAGYLKMARKKLTILSKATELLISIQPEVSGHMNFRMAAQSLSLAVGQIKSLLSVSRPENSGQTPGQ